MSGMQWLGLMDEGPDRGVILALKPVGTLETIVPMRNFF
jgi:hypothetical protein